jgi:ribosomal protein L7/L12
MFFAGWRKKKKEKKAHEAMMEEAHEAMMEEVMGFINEEKRANAIKAHRRHTGLGLKESKTFVDNLCATNCNN